MKFIIGLLIGLIANYVFPSFRKLMDTLIAKIFHIIEPSKFDLTGKWEQQFSEPSPENSSQWAQTTEIIELKQLADSVSGTGTTQNDHRIFLYKCKIQHNMIFGSYTKKGEKGNICGNGMIQLIITPDRLGMKGQATWFDADTERIESSECAWKKL